MFRETWDKKMLETPDIQICARAGDLLAYLYGEASEREAQDFKGHLLVCRSCRTELEAFGEVREAIYTWREEVLSRTPSFAAEMSPAPLPVMQEAKPQRSRLSAIREFFQFSPMWMRGATAFATLILVAILVVALMNFFDRRETPLAQDATPAPAQPIGKETAVTPSVPQQVIAEAPKETPNTITPREKVKRKSTANRFKSAGNELARNSNQNRQPKAPRLSTEERLQLSDLLIAEKEQDEDDVPRLSDLLTESN